MEDAQHPQLVQPLEPAQGERRIVEEQRQLLAQAGAGELVEDPLAQRHRRPAAASPGEMWKPSRSSSRTARSTRVGSSMNERLWRTRSTPVLEVAPAAEVVDQLRRPVRARGGAPGC